MMGSMDARRWEEIQATFDTLVELDDLERGNRLTAISASDSELQAAVESLLAADSEADARLARLEAAFLPRSVPAVDPLAIGGHTISHFLIRDLIGAGGMGVVYRADDTRLGRPVALKFLLPSYSLDASATARFLREAHSAAALDHPNLCAIHEVGASEDGRLFLAMPLYEGETLKARLAKGGLMSVGEVLEIARQVASGLKGAHTSGIVHRDLKPGNVMLLPDGTVKILDFGLAKARDQSLSETGARFGTVSYMAPEQIRAEAVDGRADLWALGVVLYEMLTGRKPFGGDEEIAVAHAILHNELDGLATHRGDVSGTLEDLVLRLLQKNPDRRHRTAADLLDDLARVGTLGAGARHSLRRRLRARLKRSSNRALMLAAGTATVLLGASGYAAIARTHVAAAAVAGRMAIAVLPFRNLSAADSSAYLADALQDEILTQLFRVPALKVIGRNSVRSFSGPTTPPLRQIGQELGVGTIVEGSVQVVGNRVRVNVQLMDPLADTPLWVERYDRTLDDVFAIQSDIARQIVATVGAALSGAEQSALAQVPTAKAQAYLLYLQGKEYERRPGYGRTNFEAAQELYERALALDPGFALAHAALSIVHGYMYWLRYDMTPTRLGRQRAEAEAAVGLAPNLPQAHEAMGKVHNVGPDTDVREGLKEIRIALRGAPNDARLWRWVASAHRRLGNWELYHESFEKAVQLDPRDIDLLSDYGGGTYERMGRYADAIRWYDRAASLSPDTFGFSIAKAWVHVSWHGHLDSVRAVMRGEPGKAFRRKGWIAPHVGFWLVERQPDSVLQVLREARVRVFQSALTFHPISLYAAFAHQLRGDRAAARAAFDSALVVIDSAILKYPEDWPVHQARGIALAGLGRHDEALVEVHTLRASFIYRKDLFLRAYVTIGAAQILAQAGEAKAAVDDLERVLSDRAPAISVHTLRLQPVWDPIRDHPRFRALLAKYAN